MMYVRTSVGRVCIDTEFASEGDPITRDALAREVFYEGNSEFRSTLTQLSRSLSVGDWMDIPRDVPPLGAFSTWFDRVWIAPTGFSLQPVPLFAVS